MCVFFSEKEFDFCPAMLVRILLIMKRDIYVIEKEFDFRPVMLVRIRKRASFYEKDSNYGTAHVVKKDMRFISFCHVSHSTKNVFFLRNGLYVMKRGIYFNEKRV